MKFKFNKLLDSNRNYVIIFACIIFLVPMIVLGVYDRASADDYGYSMLTHEVVRDRGNIIDLLVAAHKTNVNYYNNWQGLYSSAFILSFQPGIFNEHMYMITPLIVLIISFICLYFSIRILNKYFFNSSNSFVFMLSFLILAIIFLLMPSATDGIYWYNGAMNYTPWIFIVLLQLSLIIDIYNSKSKVNIILSTIIAFFTSGANHVTAFANILILLFASLYLIFKKKKYYSIFPLLSSIIGFIIMYKAPGTAIRQSTIHKSSFVETIIETFKYSQELFTSWFNFKWFLCMLIFIPIAIVVSKNIKTKIKKRNILLFIVLSYVIICAMLCVPHYAMSSFGAGRVINVIWIAFMFLSWFNLVVVMIYCFQNKIINDRKLYINTLTILVILFFIFYLPCNSNYGILRSNSHIALGELRYGIAKDYAKQIDERIKLYKSDKEEVRVDKIETKSVLFFSDITDDPNVWPNTSLGKYYNKSISLKQTDEVEN